MNRRYLNPGPGFLKGLAGLATLCILASLVLLQWRGFRDVQDDDDSGVGHDNHVVHGSDDDDSGSYSHLHPAPKGPSK